MHIKEILYPGSESFLILILSVLISSCKGQENVNEIPAITSSKQLYNHPVIYNNENLSQQISQVVRTMYQDSKGIIWFGTENGAYKLIDKSLTHIDKIISETGKGVTIKDIAEDKEGTIWFAHTDGISKIKGEIVKNYYESDGLISNDVWCIESDSAGNIWIGTIDGACVFNGKNFEDFDLPEGMIDSTLGVSSSRMIHNIFNDLNGKLWFSTNAGLFTYSKHKLTDVSRQLGLASNFVNSIFKDKGGQFWISTKDGLYVLKNNKIQNITDGIINIGKGIGSVAEDKDGKIWFVSNQHFLYNYDGKKFSEFIKSEDNKGPVVFHIYKDQDDRLWFVGYGGAYRLENGKFINIKINGPW